MSFVVAVQMIISIESFTTNLTREPIVSSVDRGVTIFVEKLGKRLWAIVAFISNTCVFVHVGFVGVPLFEGFLAHFAAVQAQSYQYTWTYEWNVPLLCDSASFVVQS